MALNKILGTFTKTLTQLESFSKKSLRENNRNCNTISSLEKTNETLLEEKERADDVHKAIKALIGDNK